MFVRGLTRQSPRKLNPHECGNTWDVVNSECSEKALVTPRTSTQETENNHIYEGITQSGEDKTK